MMKKVVATRYLFLNKSEKISKNVYLFARVVGTPLPA